MFGPFLSFLKALSVYAYPLLFAGSCFEVLVPVAIFAPGELFFYAGGILSAAGSVVCASGGSFGRSVGADADALVRCRRRCSIAPFLNLAVRELQKTRHWPAHRRNVMSEQRQPNWQHPDADYREREETEHSTADERDTSRHSHP